MKMFSSKNQHGFTIIELLLAMVFFSFLLVFATASYIQINRSYVRGANVKLVQEEARKVLSEMSSALRDNGGLVYVIDNDDITQCDPRSSNDVNVGDQTTAGDAVPSPATSTAYKCRHRLCVGNTVFAWNQAVITGNVDEHSWFEFGLAGWFAYDTRLGDTVGDPFSIIRTTGDGASEADCAENIEYLQSTALVDSNRIIVQDIDVYLIDEVRLPNTYMVRVSLSTIDDDHTDNQDLKYETVPSDNPNAPAGTNEFKAQQCHVDSGSQEFCYVETLSTIVTRR